MKLVLASSSSYKRRSLARLGLPFEAVAPSYEEKTAPGVAAPDLVRSHAFGKAVSLREAHPDAWILGADQCAEVDGAILGKPGSVENAQLQLRMLAGKEHRLWTAAVLLRPGRIKPHGVVEKTSLFMRPLTDAQINAYIERDKPLDCAGSYKIEELGVALMERVDGSDPSAIEGLPLARLSELFFELGVCVLEGRCSEDP